MSLVSHHDSFQEENVQATPIYNLATADDGDAISDSGIDESFAPDKENEQESSGNADPADKTKGLNQAKSTELRKKTARGWHRRQNFKVLPHQRRGLAFTETATRNARSEPENLESKKWSRNAPIDEQLSILEPFSPDPDIKQALTQSTQWNSGIKTCQKWMPNSERDSWKDFSHGDLILIFINARLTGATWRKKPGVLARSEWRKRVLDSAWWGWMPVSFSTWFPVLDVDLTGT